MEKSLPEMWDKTNESITQSILLKGYSQFYYPTETNNAFWLAKSRSIWRRIDRLQWKVEIWQEKVLNRIINYQETA